MATFLSVLSLLCIGQSVPLNAEIPWQQGISYTFNVSLDTDHQVLKATERIEYVNRSPYLIDTVFLAVNDHMTMEQVLYRDVPQRIAGTGAIRAIPLDPPLASGDLCRFTVDYRLDIPVHNGIFGFVPGHYEMTTWYPKVCRFDESGWHLPMPGTGEARYGTYAAYDVVIDLPSEYIIAATGVQVDPVESRFMDTYILTGRKEHTAERRQAHFIAPRATEFVWACDPFFTVQRQTVQGFTVLFFYRPYDIETWESARMMSADAVSRYQEWFGALPYDNIALVQGLCREAYPQVVFVTQAMDPLTRLFEIGLATDISKQWFRCAIDTDRHEDAWFSEGLATYASIRYMEDKYGEDESMVKSAFFPDVPLRYFHRANYYLMHTNRLERPVKTPEADFDITLAYTNSVSSKPGLFFISLEKMTGLAQFKDIVKTFIDRHALESVHSSEFFDMLGERSGQPISSLYGQFAATTAYCDWRVGRVTKNAVVVEHRGGLALSTEVVIRTEHDTLIYTLDAEPNTQTILIPEQAGKVKAVAIDPSESLLDPYYWNNFYPRRIKIRPVTSFEMPSFTTYNVYWLLYPWYDSYDGITANFYWLGDQFADFEFVKGGHQIIGGINYGFKSDRVYVNAGYQTPVVFTDGARVRVALKGAHMKRGNDASIGLVSSLGRPFTSSPQTTVENRLVFSDVSSFNGIDSSDWSLGTNVSFENSFRYRHSGWDVAIEFSLSHRALGSDWEYIKTTCAVERTLPFFVPCRARIFAGKIIGDAPVHEHLFVSGALRINWFADLLFSQSGSLSPQEHIHIPGDGSMRGYQSLHLWSDQMYACNLEFPILSVFHGFVDFGYHEEFAFDAGVSLVFSAATVSSLPFSGLAVSANFPLYTYTDEPWALRWSIGFSM